MNSLILRSRDRRRAIAGAAVLVALLIAAAALIVAGPSTAEDPYAETAPPGFFGVDGLNSTAADFDAMTTADVGVYRAVFPLGLFKHRRKGHYNWSYADNIVGNTARNNIDLVPMMYGTAPWISDDLNSTPLRGAARAAYTDFLTTFVRRYGRDGSFWAEDPYMPYRPLDTYQIWNEPNSMTWWGPRPKPSQYATLLERSASDIHAVDPEARIMTAGIVARPTNRNAIPGTTYLKKLFAIKKAAEAADVVAYHPFAASSAAVKKQLELARKTLQKSKGRDLPIAITEIGWGTKGPRDHPLLKSVSGQKRTMASTFDMAIRNRERLGLDSLLWFLWREQRDDLCLWCESSGLVKRNSEPKPLLDTFRHYAVPRETQTQPEGTLPGLPWPLPKST